MDASPELLAKVRFHAGVPNASTAVTVMGAFRLQLGTVYSIDKGLQYAHESHRPFLMLTLGRLDEIDELVMEATRNTLALRVGDITLNPDARRDLIDAYQEQQHRLATILGVTDVFAIALRNYRNAASGLNGRCT